MRRGLGEVQFIPATGSVVLIGKGRKESRKERSRHGAV